MLSGTEENYLKALFHLTNEIALKDEAGTNELAALLEVTPASVNGMLKKLKKKGLVSYKKYGKITLTPKGRMKAVEVVRKHRLWETFLHEKLEFSWSEVHEVAEQLEHIKSQKLINQLEKFLGFPEIDPHGVPIPNSKGEIKPINYKNLAEIETGETCTFSALKSDSTSLMDYLDKLGLKLGCEITILSRQEFDGSLEIEFNDKQLLISKKTAKSLLVL